MKLRPQQIRRRNNMLRELSELVTTSLKKHGISDEKAANEAEEVAFQLHQRWAGITFTFPVKDELARKRLELHILEEYDGTNADILVRRYGITEDWIYSVLRTHQRRRIDENQTRFDFGDTGI
ncbi:Mor transcription activator family protein [Pseudomonas sp.]|uniref:Mor transcription activator family protein n=1 Tax=Pseudomonas sp. TaxID=306 RepID=UPI003D14F6B1